MTSPLVLGFSQAVMNHPFRLAQVESMKAAARSAGVRLLVTDGKGSTDVEKANIRWLVEQGVDALLVSSLSGPKVYPAYRSVAASDIPLVLVASGVPTDHTPYTAFVGPDEIDMGARAAGYIGERLHGRGHIVVVRGLAESSNSRLRGTGFDEELGKRFPDIDVLAHEHGNWLRRPTQDLMVRLFAKLDRIDAVFAENDEMALGAVDALRSRHRQSEAFVVGLDGQREALREIWLGGPFEMTIKSEWDSAKAVEVAIAAASGVPVPRRVILDAPIIDRQTVEEFLVEDAAAYAEQTALEGPPPGGNGFTAVRAS
jgi:ABC-type sugar transport system substrate-binding protein